MYDVDYVSKENGTMTLRFRGSMEQVRRRCREALGRIFAPYRSGVR